MRGSREIAFAAGPCGSNLCGSSKLVSMTSFGDSSAEGGSPRKTRRRREAPTTRALIAWMIKSQIRCRRGVRSYRLVPGSHRRGTAGDTLKIRKLLIGWRFAGCGLRVQLVPLPPSRSEMAWPGGIWAPRYSRWTTLEDSGQTGAARVGRIDRSVERSPCARRSDRPKQPRMSRLRCRRPVRLDRTVTATVTARHAHPGETVEVAAKIVTIADLNRVRIEAEVDAYDSGRVALGAEVRITAEGFERASWLAKVEEIPDSVVPRRIRPEDPGRPI